MSRNVDKMDKWEITAGRQVEWKDYTHWWVMTWFKNGGSISSKPSPLHVFVICDGCLLLDYPPNHAILWGAKDTVAGEANDKMYFLLPSNIWARMPFEVPSVPNVEMFFVNNPYTI